MTEFRTKFIDTIKGIWSDLWQDGKGRVLLAVSAGWFLSIGIRFIYPSLLPFLRETFGMDLTVAGFLLSALWLAYALGQFPGGVLGDKIGEGNILVISTAVSTVTILFVALSFNLFMIFAATAAFGFATGLYGPHRFTIFTDIYADRSGTAVGITMAAGSIGNTVLPAIAVTIAGYATWRLGYGILVPAFFVVCVAIYRYVPERTSATSGETISKSTLRRLAASIVDGGIPIVVTIHIVLSFVSNGFLGFYPTYLIEVKGFSPQVAAVLYGMYFAMGIAIQPITGMCRDRFGSKRTLIYVTGIFFLGLVALQFGQNVIHIALLTALLGHRNGLGVITNTFIADAIDDDIKGSGLGLLRTSWILIGATSPIFVGFLGDLGELNSAFLVLAGIAGAAVLLSLLVPSGRPGG